MHCVGDMLWHFPPHSLKMITTSFTKKTRSQPWFGQFFFHEFYKVYEMDSTNKKDVTYAFSLLCYLFTCFSFEQNISQVVQSNAMHVSDMDFLQYININWHKCWLFLRFSMIWDANFKAKKTVPSSVKICTTNKNDQDLTHVV